jgi:hypothetical protein
MNTVRHGIVTSIHLIIVETRRFALMPLIKRYAVGRNGQRHSNSRAWFHSASYLASNIIFPDDKTVSRKHALFELKPLNDHVSTVGFLVSLCMS